jgi:tRNA(Ile)-lysidine synthase
MRLTPLETAVTRFLDQQGVPAHGDALVVGLSGGADSVALLDVLVRSGSARGFTVIAAHLDHGLRPASPADARFCAELCARFGVRLETGTADVRSSARRLRTSLEAAARHERYAFLQEVQRSGSAVAVAVAHTRDDQAETVLMHLARGAASRGLGGMRPFANGVMRPLLGCSREDVLAHLKQYGLPWVEDASNGDRAFLRNRVRLDLLPYLERHFNPRIRATLARSAALLGAEADALSVAADELLARAQLAATPTEVTLDRSALAAAPPALAGLALRNAIERVGGLHGVGSAHTERLLALTVSKRASGRVLPLPGGRVARCRFGALSIGPAVAPPAPFALPLPVPGQVSLPGGLSLAARPWDERRLSSPLGTVIALDDTAGLMVRTRRPGDRVQHRGRQVSLKRYFLDRRVPVDVRTRSPLVATEHQVWWVVGQPCERQARSRLVYIEVRDSGTIRGAVGGLAEGGRGGEMVQ